MLSFATKDSTEFSACVLLFEHVHYPIVLLSGKVGLTATAIFFEMLKMCSRFKFFGIVSLLRRARIECPFQLYIVHFRCKLWNTVQRVEVGVYGNFMLIYSTV